MRAPIVPEELVVVGVGLTDMSQRAPDSGSFLTFKKRNRG
jgi:hypothetical protein